MSANQFDVIAELISSREPTRAAARLVLVEGFRPSDAAKRFDLLPQSVNKTLRRFEAAEWLILDAYSPFRDSTEKSCNKPLKGYTDCIESTYKEKAMTNRSPILTDTDHRNLDGFLSAILDDFHNGAITKAQVMGGLAQAIGAVDKGNHGEASNWFKQGRKLIRLAV
ncbi:hypothetical protein V3C40_27640 [Janthinobacterium sp. LS2A]|uniref:hypothetical protein n=1 Tax=Janthinobacterium sp. LS2A TaxID=3118590 RepID=UPI002F931467